MTLATDRVRSIPAARTLACLALTLALAVTETGCARLRGFRHGHDDPPAFGTYPAGRDGGVVPGGFQAEAPPTPAASDEGRLAANPEPSSAPRADEPAAPEPAGRPGDTAGSPRVALEPPVTSARAAAAEPDGTATAAPALASLASPEPAKGREAPAARADLGSVLAEARRALDALASYQVVMNHQERVKGHLNPPEDVMMSIRRSPQAVRLEWNEGKNKGREVIYAADAHGGLMHVRMPPTPIPIRLSMRPDSPMATSNSRHPITEAGFDTILRNMETPYQRQQGGDHSLGNIRYEGLETPEGRTKPCHKIVRVTPDNETWTVYLDPDTRLPAFVSAVAGNGDLLERYVFRAPTTNPPALAAAEAFDPDARWGPAKGLLQRLARSGGEANNPQVSR